MVLKRTALPYLLLLSLLSTGFYGVSQSFAFKIDHYSMIVEDLSLTGDFYEKVLGLQDIPHPANAEGFRWFSIDGESQLHLIRKDVVAKERNKSVHLCLSTADLPAFISYLNKEEIPFWDWPGKLGAVSNREDGVQQIYLQDPEGNWVEINNAGN